MCVSAQAVRNTSLSGEFDTIPDAKIDVFVAEVCPLYGTHIKRNHTAWQLVVALHVAHNLHEALLMEGEGGAQGPVQSESFAQVGSRTYAVAAPNNDDPQPGWNTSSYGRRWRRHYVSLPTSFNAV